ncbi:MAG TPA: DUF433 domain-containing protein [Pyrinomonadaceae bacterium]|jgi:hypothetical protein
MELSARATNGRETRGYNRNGRRSTFFRLFSTDLANFHDTRGRGYALISRSLQLAPVFSGTRLPVQTLFDYPEGGDSLDEFPDEFQALSRGQAIEVLEKLKELHHPTNL